jgi:hypothetical protein
MKIASQSSSAQVLKSLTKRNLSPQAWIYHKSLKPHKEVLGRAHKGFRMSIFVGGTSSLQRMVTPTRDLEWLSRRTTEYHSSKDDAMGVVEDLDELGKLGRGFSSMDNLEKVDIGDGVIPQPTYVNSHLNTSQK